MIIAKLDDRATADRADDQLLPGATFDVRPDDGDGVYEPTGDDGPPLDAVELGTGFVIFKPNATGRYWVAEVVAPDGFDTAAPIMVDYAVPIPPENCVVIEGDRRCRVDEDGTGGFVIVVVRNSPIGGLAPADAVMTPPPTDTVGTETTGSRWFVPVLAGAIALVVGLLTGWPRRPNQR